MSSCSVDHVDQHYLDTLSQRAQINVLGAGHDQVVVSIPQTDYETLVRTVKQYVNLTLSLLRGGIDQAVLELLCCELPDPHAEYLPHHGDAANIQPSTPNDVLRDSILVGHNANTSCISTDNPTTDGMISSHHPSFVTSARRILPKRDAVRTLIMYGLPDGVSYQELCDSVRGGALLSLFMRFKEHWASISFVHEADAQRFFDQSRLQGFYIRNQRIVAKWSDRQVLLHTFLGNKISLGATRNLVILNCDHALSDCGVRQDLEHIHNLVIIKVAFLERNCHIQTNSVANAAFAHSCLKSQFKYKRFRIEYDIDECALPLEGSPDYKRVPTTRAWREYAHSPQSVNQSCALPARAAMKKATTKPPPSGPAPPSNRFLLLNISSGQDSGEGDDDEDDQDDKDDEDDNDDNNSIQDVDQGDDDEITLVRRRV